MLHPLFKELLIDLSCVSASEHLALSYISTADLLIKPAAQGVIPDRAGQVVLALPCLLSAALVVDALPLLVLYRLLVHMYELVSTE